MYKCLCSETFNKPHYFQAHQNICADVIQENFLKQYEKTNRRLCLSLKNCYTLLWNQSFWGNYTPHSYLHQLYLIFDPKSFSDPPSQRLNSGFDCSFPFSILQ